MHVTNNSTIPVTNNSTINVTNNRLPLVLLSANVWQDDAGSFWLIPILSVIRTGEHSVSGLSTLSSNYKIQNNVKL